MKLKEKTQEQLIAEAFAIFNGGDKKGCEKKRTQE